MSCCGQKRRAVAAPPSRSDASGVAIEYRGVRGARVEFLGATGRTYVFTDATPILTVHPRDVRGLLRTNRFRLV